MSSEYRRLRVCQNCLDTLSLNGFRRRMRPNEKERIVAEFTPDDFFKIYPQSLHAVKPRHDSDTAPLNDYTPDFPAIRERVREEKGWQCQRCEQILSSPDLRRFLQVHHINGMRSDNRDENLSLLCVACHAEQPQHAHVRSTAAYEEFIKLYPQQKTLGR